VYNPPNTSFTIPSVSTVCTNQIYSFNNTTVFDAGSNPTWQWSVNGTNVSTTKNLDLTITSTYAQTIALTASIPGCSTQATNSISTIVDGPKVDFTSGSTGCVGTSIKFTNSTTGSATSYAWDFGDGNTSSQTTTASVSNSYASAGPYAVKLTVSNAAGCQNFVSKNVSIYSNPQPAFAIEAPPFSCANYPAQFDNNTPPPSDSNIVSWAWAFGDTANGSSTQKNPSYTFTAEGSYNVSLTATTNFGCSNTLQNSIAIGASPTANFKTSPACVNQGTQFTDLSSGSITSYEWAVQSSVLSGATPSAYTFKSAGSFPVTLTVTGSSGCKNQLTKTIVVPEMPIIDFTVTAPCTRNPTIFQELNAGGADPAAAWNWSFNGVNGGTGSPFSYTFPIVGGYSVTLTSTRQSGCVYTTSKNVIINNGPIAAFTPSSQAGAAPLTVDFENNSIADSYLWKFGDADNTTSTTLSPIFTYTKLGKYKAMLTANNSYGCTDTLSTEINVVIPQVDLAMQGFSLVNDPTSGSSRAVVTVYNTGNIPLTNPEVKIDLGGGAIVKEAIQETVIPGKSVTATLALEIIPRSIDYICAIVNATSDINPANDEKCVSITNSDYLFAPYPNPASGKINMDWISASSEEVKVSVYKTTGELAFQQQFSNVTPGLVQLSISTTSLSNGLYLIRFEGAKEQKTFRIMVAN
jgi:PKD repeat protein